MIVNGIELGGEVMTYVGVLLAWWGGIKAKRPIDPTLLARVGGNDIRLSRVRGDKVPPRNETEPGDPFGNFGE
jgi:hypothetical protein